MSSFAGVLEAVRLCPFDLGSASKSVKALQSGEKNLHF
jgi:hypothetical protein